MTSISDGDDGSECVGGEVLQARLGLAKRAMASDNRTEDRKPARGFSHIEPGAHPVAQPRMGEQCGSGSSLQNDEESLGFGGAALGRLGRANGDGGSGFVGRSCPGLLNGT